MRVVYCIPLKGYVPSRRNRVEGYRQDIKDQLGGVLPGVDVVIRNLDTGLSRSVVTDANGYFTVPGLAPGRYEARAGLAGFTTAVQTGIVLEVAQQAGLNVVLKLG